MCVSPSLLTLSLTLSKLEFLLEGGNLPAQIAPNSQPGGIKYFVHFQACIWRYEAMNFIDLLFPFFLCSVSNWSINLVLRCLLVGAYVCTGLNVWLGDNRHTILEISDTHSLCSGSRVEVIFNVSWLKRLWGLSSEAVPLCPRGRGYCYTKMHKFRSQLQYVVNIVTQLLKKVSMVVL